MPKRPQTPHPHKGQKRKQRTHMVHTTQTSSSQDIQVPASVSTNPQAKKLKPDGQMADRGDFQAVPSNIQAPTYFARPCSPVAGPSRAPSDPNLQVQPVGLLPPYRCFDPMAMEEGSSQEECMSVCMSATDLGGTSTSMSSTNVEVGSKPPTSSSAEKTQNTSSDATATKSSTSMEPRRRRKRRVRGRPRHRTNRRRRRQGN